MKNKVALMGDLVKSTKFKSQDYIYIIFNEAVHRINEKYKNKILYPLTITLGDEFQSIIDGYKNSFIIANDLRFELLSNGIDCRFSIGDIILNKNKENYENSWNILAKNINNVRNILNEKKKGVFYRFIIQNNEKLSRTFEILSLAMSMTEERWSETEIEYIMAYKKTLDIEKLSNFKKVSKSYSYKVIRKSQYNEYIEIFKYICESLDEIDMKLWDK